MLCNVLTHAWPARFLYYLTNLICVFCFFVFCNSALNVSMAFESLDCFALLSEVLERWRVPTEAFCKDFGGMIRFDLVINWFCRSEIRIEYSLDDRIVWYEYSHQPYTLNLQEVINRIQILTNISLSQDCLLYEELSWLNPIVAEVHLSLLGAQSSRTRACWLDKLTLIWACTSQERLNPI